jgi:hypothetical protein
VRPGHIRSGHCKNEAGQAGCGRDNRRQIDIFDLKRKHAHARQHEHPAKKATGKSTGEPPSRGDKLHYRRKNTERRKQDIIAQLRHDKLPASS